MLETIPISTMMKVSVAGGATATSFRTRAAMRPASSAKPTPIITTRMSVIAVNSWKFLVNEVKMKRIPLPVSRPCTLMVSLWIAY